MVVDGIAIKVLFSMPMLSDAMQFNEYKELYDSRIDREMMNIRISSNSFIYNIIDICKGIYI